jgi:hypothetical protein
MSWRGEQEPKTIPFSPQIRPPLTAGSRGRSSSSQSSRLEYTTKNASRNVCNQKNSLVQQRQQQQTTKVKTFSRSDNNPIEREQQEKKEN